MNNYRVLLIDDDEDFRVLLEYMLDEVRRSKFDIHHCEDIATGLSAVKQQAFDVCLLDYRLRDGTGIELLNRLPHEGVDFPVIFMTGQNGGDVDIDALNAGASDYLPKDALNGELIDRSVRYAVERKRAENTLRNMALTDNLTGLANRALLNQTLEMATGRAARSGKPFALVFIDVDHFKHINDALGHIAADHLLVELAHRLKASARSTDLVARLGGDEFAMVLDEMQCPENAATVARKILEACAKPYMVDNHELSIRISMGVALHPRDGATPEELERAADTAMYEVKRSGRNGYRFFSESMQRTAIDNAKTEQDLALALERDELKVYYQPKVTGQAHRIAGAEALLRWERDGALYSSPAHFIPIAEQSGLIDDIGRWVLKEACLRTRRCQVAKDDAPHTVAVNVSMRQLNGEHSFADQVIEVLSEVGMRPEQLELEVTESALAGDQDKVNEELKKLHDFGVTIAVDDFGTGFSSLAYLADLPIDCLKIDRSFVSQCLNSSKHQAIVKSICSLARSLGLVVVGEGIENRATANFLEALGCDLMQGYLFGKPMPFADYSDTLEAVSVAA